MPASQHSIRAFTLVEVMVSLGVMSVLLLGLSSALIISAQSLEQAGPEVADTMTAHEIIERINGDLMFAITFTERTSTAMTFTIPDRNGDDIDETLRYAWSGTLGDPLTLSTNGSEPVTVASDVRSLDFLYHIETLAGDSGDGEGGDGGGDDGGGAPPTEELLMYFSDSGSGSISDEVIEYSPKFIAQYFKPTHSGSTISWGITRIKFVGKHDGSPSGNMRVEVRTAEIDGSPTETVLTTAIVPRAALAAEYGWAEAAFPPITGLDPTLGYCFVIQNEPDASDPAKFALTQPGSSETATGFVTDTGGSSWDRYTGSDFQFYVYGTRATSP